MSAASVSINGRITADPILRRTPSGLPVVNFTVAHTPQRKNEAGVNEDAGDTLFLEVAAWRLLAENVAATLHKGDAVVVEGRLGVRHWQTEQGEKRTSVTCEAESVAVDLRWATATVVRYLRPAAEPAA